MKYKVTARLKSKKFEREFENDWDMKEFITDWGRHGISNFKIKVIKDTKIKSNGVGR